MMNTTPSVSQSVKRCVDDHLDAIDDALRNGGLSRSERQNILDDVETQVHEMLADRAPNEPTVEDIRAVLAEMDSPESYAGEEKSVPTIESEKQESLFASGRRALRLSVGSLLAAFLIIVFTALLLTYYRNDLATGPLAPMLSNISISLTAFLLPCQMVAFILGLIARSKPMGQEAYTLSGSVIVFYIALLAFIAL